MGGHSHPFKSSRERESGRVAPARSESARRDRDGSAVPPPPRATAVVRDLDRARGGFTRTDLLVTVAVLTVVAFLAESMRLRARSQAGIERCLANLQQVNRAVLQYAGDHGHVLPLLDPSPAPGGWWWYKELVKRYAGLTETSSPADLVFACPQDRGYTGGAARAAPFCRSARHDYTSYVFNGVNLPGIPNLAGRSVSAVARPERGLLVMEWTAHAPLSWHGSRTGTADTPFYCDAESAVGFVDGHAAYIKIYYDGLNAAYTRDPTPTYAYSYSGN